MKPFVQITISEAIEYVIGEFVAILFSDSFNFYSSYNSQSAIFHLLYFIIS